MAFTWFLYKRQFLQTAKSYLGLTNMHILFLPSRDYLLKLTPALYAYLT